MLLRGYDMFIGRKSKLKLLENLEVQSFDYYDS